MSVENIEVKADPVVIAAWREHFASGHVSDPNWLTMKELAAIAGVKIGAMKIRVREGLDSGDYVMQTGYRKRSDGRPAQVPVYKLVKGIKRGKRT